MDNSNMHRSLERQHEAGAYSNGMSLNSLYTMSDYVSPYTTQAPLFGKAVDPQNRPPTNELGGFPNMDYARHYIPRSEHSDINSFRNYIMSRIEQPDFLSDATKRLEHNGDKLVAPYTSGYAHSYPNPKDTFRSMTSISDHLQGYGMNCKQQPDYISNSHAGFLGGINYNSMYDMPGELMHPQVPQAQVIRVPQQDEHIPNNSGLISPKQKLLGLPDLSQNDSGNKNVLPPPLLPPQQHMSPQKNQTLMGCFTGVPTLPTSDISSNIMDVNSSASMLLNVSTPSSTADKLSSPSMSMCNNVSSSGSAVKTPPGFDSMPILSPSVYPVPPVNKLNDETNTTEEQQEKSMPPPDVKEETNKELGRDDQASTMSDDTIIAKDEDIGKVEDENEMESCVTKTKSDYIMQTVEEPDSSKSSLTEETSKTYIAAAKENSTAYPVQEVENSRDSASELRQLVQEKTAIENKTESSVKEEMKDLDPEKQFALAFKQAQAASMKVTAETAKKNAGSQEFDAQEEFIPSMVEDMPGMVYQCHLCSYSGTSRFHFNSHMNTHFDHKCSLCDYTSRTEARLKKHIREYHADLHPETVMSTRVARTNNAPPKQKVYRCKQCDFAATSKNDFWNHSRTHIKADKMLSCPKCNFVTEYKHHLEYHLRNHFGSKPFKCNKCNYSCVNKSMLNSHMKSHSNFYQYRCQDCTYATKYCHSLKLHLRKYNHKPATVLSGGDMFVLQNPDFLLGRRGPRGPKKKMFGLPEIPPLINGVMTHPAHFGFPMPASMNGIPPNLLGSFLLHRPPLGQRELSSPPVSSASGMMKCALCDFTTNHPELLNRHVLMHAAAENQDLCKLYGISSETIMAETKHTPSAHHLAVMAQEGQLSPGEICRWNKSASTSPTTTENSSLPQQSTGSIYKNVDGVEKARVLDLSCNVDAESSIQEPVVSGMIQPNQKTDAVIKDEYQKDKVETSLPSQSESQVQSSGTSVSPPRNRRKGKAYKLDRICMKLQKQFSPAGESGEGYSSDSCGAGQFGNDADMMEDDSILSKSELEPGERMQEQDESIISSEYNAKVMTTSNSARDSSGKSQAHYPDFTSLYQSNRWGLGRPDFKNHSMNTNHAPEAYVCSYCEISFKNCIMYTMHMGYHGYQDPFKCNMCGHPCEDKVSFFLHIARAAHM